MEKITHEEYLRALKLIRDYKDQILDFAYQIDSINTTYIGKTTILYSPDTNVMDCDMTVRLLNVIKANDLGETLGDIAVNHTKRKIRRARNMGVKSLRELEEKLLYAGLKLKP